jgi:AraC-like DNA-binding protein
MAEADELLLMKNLVWPIPDSILALLPEMISCYSRERAALLKSQIPYYLCLLLLRITAQIGLTGLAGKYLRSREDIFHAITNYVNKNLSRKLTVKELARHFHMSESNLRKIFRQHTGRLSLGDFVRRHRINHALTLLPQSGKNISEIAAECGFLSIYSFSRSFKKRLGCSPAAYRHRHRKKEG